MLSSLAANPSMDTHNGDVNVWSIWYAARFGKAERVRFILDHSKEISSIDDQDEVCYPPWHILCAWLSDYRLVVANAMVRAALRLQIRPR
jgi:hypothetical protein